MSSRRVKFYWESENQHYQFENNKKYLIYYRGCYCPPHRGHFNTIADFTHLSNAKFFVHQGGAQRRHGVPYELNRKIWKIYIKELLPEDRFILMGRGHYEEQDMVDHPYVKEADTIVIIAGNENYDPAVKEYEDTTKKYKEVFDKLLRRKKEVIFLYLDRPKLSSLSATELCKSVIQYQNRSDKHERLRKYFPEGLSDKGIKYIVRKLEECDLK